MADSQYTRRSCLEELVALGAQLARDLEAGDIDAFNRTLDRQQGVIERLKALMDASQIDDDEANAALARTIDRQNRAVADQLDQMMMDVSQERRALAQNIAGVKAYTKKPIREDGSFIDTLG